MASIDEFGLTGAFIVPTTKPERKLFIISSGSHENEEWEHVSLHVKLRINKRVKDATPYWDEMCLAKSLFWLPDEGVVQYHPPQKEYVNVHEHVLHLWKNRYCEFLMPDTIHV